MQLNLPRFYVGQRVVCTLDVTDSEGIPFNTTDILVVKEIRMPCCGKLTLHFGHIAQTSITKCNTCGNHLSSGKLYYKPEFFRPVDELKLPLMTFNKLKEVEKQEPITLN